MASLNYESLKPPFFKDVFHHGALSGVELLDSSDHPILAPQAAGATMCFTTQEFKASVLSSSFHCVNYKCSTSGQTMISFTFNVSLFPSNLPNGKCNHKYKYFYSKLT
jgi:hypothetical protein